MEKFGYERYKGNMSAFFSVFDYFETTVMIIAAYVTI